MGNLTDCLFAVAQKTKEPTVNENVTELTGDNSNNATVAPV